jgi:hypothetical protein
MKRLLKYIESGDMAQIRAVARLAFVDGDGRLLAILDRAYKPAWGATHATTTSRACGCGMRWPWSCAPSGSGASPKARD